MQISESTSSSASRAGSAPPNLLTGIFLVLVGSASYGLLSTFVKLAYHDGFTTAEVTLAQSGVGALVLTLIAYFVGRKSRAPVPTEKLKLALVGIPMGLTSVVYYVAVQYIPASIAVVLLMQSIWMGVVFESVMKRTWPTFAKIVAVVFVLVGTLFATDALSAANASLDPRGVVFGILAALSYSAMLAAAGSVCLDLHPVKRSQYMLYGGLGVVLIYGLMAQILPNLAGLQPLPAEFTRAQDFNFEIFGYYGIILALFGTVLPPILLNKGFPITGVGLGSIISSVELPFAALVAFCLLDEKISASQLFGIALIIASVFLLNYRLLLPQTGRGTRA